MISDTLTSRAGLMEVRLSEIYLFITLLALENFVCLVPANQYIISIFKYSDIGVVMAILWSLWILLRNIGHPLGRMHFIVPATLAVISIYLSAVSAYRHFGQSILQGILPFRRLIAIGVFCFALCGAIRTGLVSRKSLITMLYIIGSMELVLFTLQGLLAGHITFLQLDTSESRFGMTRLRAPYLLTTVLGIFSFKEALTKQGENQRLEVFNLVFSFWSVLLLGFVIQNRAPTLILVISYLVAILLWRGGSSDKLIGIVILCALIILFSSTDLVQSSIQGLKGQDTSAQTATLSIRQQGREYYLQKLQTSPFVGFGVPNENYYPATIAAGENFGYFIADNGVFGFAYQLGIFGLIWLVILYYSAIKRSISVFRSTGDFSYLQYFLFEIGNLYMGMHWFYYYPLPFMVVLVLLDTKSEIK